MMSVQDAENGDVQQEVPHDRYEDTNRKCYNSQSDVTTAWVNDKYPTHNVGRNGAELYSSPNFRGIQHPDGRGTLWHYRTREAIRTRNGLIINNQQCWSSGFAHCSSPSRSERDGTVPLEAIGEFLDDRHTIYDITAVHEEEDYPKRRIAEIAGGEYGVYYAVDPSQKDWKYRYFMVRLSSSELEAIESPGDAEAYLKPHEVMESDLPIVHSKEYRKTRLNEEEREAHLEAGGKLSRSRSSWRDTRINRQYYRADLQGDVVVRQGEWFFIPVDSVPFEVTNRRPVMKECPECGGTEFDVPTYKCRCSNCGYTKAFPASRSLDGGNHIAGYRVIHNSKIYVRGTVRHDDNDHHAVNLGDTWHLAVRHGRDALSYRTGMPDGRTGGGWD